MVIKVTTTLSLLLALASTAMWVRSQFVTEAWEFRPRPALHSYNGVGWHKQRMVESAKGRVAYVKYDVFLGDPAHAPGHRRRLTPPETVHGGIPGVIEWRFMPQQRWFIAVSWLVPAFAGSLLPAVRAWRRRRLRVQAFPVGDAPTARPATEAPSGAARRTKTGTVQDV
jgi:hypothetical protein